MEAFISEENLSDVCTNLNSPSPRYDLNSVNSGPENKSSKENDSSAERLVCEKAIAHVTSDSNALGESTTTCTNLGEAGNLKENDVTNYSSVKDDIEVTFDNTDTNIGKTTNVDGQCTNDTIMCEGDIEITYDNTCTNIGGTSNVGGQFTNDTTMCEGDVEVTFDNTCTIIGEASNVEGQFTNDITMYEGDIEVTFDNTYTNTGKTNNVEGAFTNDTTMCGDIEVVYDDNSQNDFYKFEYDFDNIPTQITGSWKEFSHTKRHNFTRGCKWAPDGSCILTCSDDNVLRIFNLPHQLWNSSQWDDITEMEAVVKISEGELIYDYTWYPLMNSNDASTCCLASTSRKSTVHLWDGFTGELRASYRSFNQMDEIVTPHSLSFDSDGQKLFCGFEKVVRIFNVDTPGRNFEERRVFAKKSGQSGIISCFAFTSSDKNISAAGSYQKTIGIYSEPSGELEVLLEGQKNGITQLQFSPDGTYLYSGGRKDPEILCWDLRNLGTVLFSLRRSCVTNQRMYFDISRCGKYVVSGNQNGVITFWDVTKEPKVVNEEEFAVLEPVQFFLGHDDCVNGISLNPSFPLLCSSSGQRKFPALLEDEDDEAMFSPKIGKWDNSLRLWWIGKC